MYSLNDMCCICLYKAKDLQNLSVISSDEISYYIKLISCIPEMKFKEMNDQRLSCMECFNTLEALYKFRLKCLRSKSILIDYYFKQYSTSNASVHFSDCLTTISKIDVKKELENQEIDEKSAIESLMKNEDENDKECHEFNFENVTISENNTINVNLIKTEPINKELNNIYETMEEVEDNELSDNVDEIEPAYIQVSSGNPLEMKDLESNIDKNTFQNMIPSTQNYDGFSVNNENPSSNSTSDKTFQCNICNKIFSRSTVLARHIKIHTGIKPYECHICNKKFTQSSSVTLHMRIHTGEKPHECSVCQKRFLRPADLEYHLRIHTGEKKHECSICNQKFTHTSHLTTHMRTHTGEKPYECTVCKKRFSQSCSVTSHMLSHTGEKNHECSVCKRSFTLASTLSVHMNTHTGYKPYECSVCGKKFSLTAQLNRHMRTHS